MSFTICSHIWNSLPAALRTAMLSPLTFARHLKSHLFDWDGQRVWVLFRTHTTNLRIIIITDELEIILVLKSSESHRQSCSIGSTVYMTACDLQNFSKQLWFPVHQWTYCSWQCIICFFFSFYYFCFTFSVADWAVTSLNFEHTLVFVSFYPIM